MRRLWLTAGLVVAAHGALCVHAQQFPPPIPAGQLVREVVYNETRDHEQHGYWRYWVQRRLQQQTQLEDQVETAQGPIARLALSNGRPLTPAAEREEQARLDRLVSSAGEQAKHLQAYEDDENRIGRILAMLPDAFLYEYDGGEDGCHRLRFRPNPDYSTRSIEARIFHSMSGTLWVNARYKRLARLDGRFEENVDFGYGILGRLYKGGWFQLQRTQVSPTDWKTDRIEVHLNGRALLVKSFARETSEARGGFLPVPAGMSLAQGMALLEENQARTEAQTPIRTPAAEKTALIAPAALALRR
ncbi:MAG: hypothetical protein ABR912_09205 [Terracidiphilus sp.]|jgi:hypothetical protein